MELLLIHQRIWRSLSTSIPEAKPEPWRGAVEIKRTLRSCHDHKLGGQKSIPTSDHICLMYKVVSKNSNYCPTYSNLKIHSKFIIPNLISPVCGENEFDVTGHSALKVLASPFCCHHHHSLSLLQITWACLLHLTRPQPTILGFGQDTQV